MRQQEINTPQTKIQFVFSSNRKSGLLERENRNMRAGEMRLETEQHLQSSN